MQLRWSHAVLKVRDMETMVRFYEDVLGMEVADRGLALGNAGPELVFMSQDETEHHQLALAQIRTDEDPPNSLDHMAFRVGGMDDVREMMARVADFPGIDDASPVTHGNTVSVYFKDPEGNGIEVFCDTPWHVVQPVIHPWDPSQSDEEVLRAVEAEFASRPGSGPLNDYLADRAEHFASRKTK